MRRRNPRRAFSLMELLVVLSIIGVLIALTAAAVLRFRSRGPAMATSANMGKVHAKFREQLKAVTDKSNRDPLGDPTNPYVASALQAGVNAADAPVRARYVRLRQIQAFPRTFFEVFWPDPAWQTTTAPNAWQPYVRRLAAVNVKPSNYASWSSTPAEVQASICLLMSLEEGPQNSGAMGEDLSNNAVAKVGDLDRGIVDAWGQPVTFTRQYGFNPNVTLAQGRDEVLGILSFGNDRKPGINYVTSPGTDPVTKLALDPTFTVVTSAQDVRDNVLVTNP